ncbi:hypothetical protein J7643_08185 [bacterium]|nr:hypothetical protein [bacterium]
MPDHRSDPDDQTSRGQGGTISGAETFVAPVETLKKPVAEADLTPSETPPDTERGGQRISGPGANDLTRGLP